MARAAIKQTGGRDLWLAAGLRTPFTRVGGALAGKDAIELSVPLAKAMLAQATPDLSVWGAVIPSLMWSNIAREVMVEAGGAEVPAYSVVLACATSMVGAFTAGTLLDDAADRSLALVGGAESMSRVQIGLTQGLSDSVARFAQAKTLGDRFKVLQHTQLSDVRLHIPKVKNRITGKSMGEHTEEMAKGWSITRAEQDELAYQSHIRAAAAWKAGFFDDLVIRMDEVGRDGTVRPDTSLEKLAKLSPVFDTTSGHGSLTAGNSSPLTDGAASIWVATAKGLDRLPAQTPRARLVDFEVNAIDLRHEYLLMAPAYSIPRLLARNGLAYEDVALWEIHEAFSAQVATHLKALQDAAFLKDKAKVSAKLGRFPVERMNPNGGSVALGHPFGATGARILSQAVKELSAMPAGSHAIVSICADGGQGGVALLRNS
jgi:acetyl-CoA C-acetyltransferase